MLYTSLVTVLFILFSGISALVVGQTPGLVKTSVIAGDVVSIDESHIVIKTKDGEVTGMLAETTVYKKTSPTNPSFSAATATTRSEISVADKVAATGILSDDGKSFPAKSVYIMTKADIADKQKNEAQEWRTRGVAGRVTGVDPATGTVTIAISGIMGTTPMKLTAKPDVMVRRYAKDSVRFDRAEKSTFGEIKEGDMLRALGDRSEDGTSCAAAEVVFGSFQTIAGTVKAVDIAKNEIVIADMQTKKDITVSLAGASVMKKYPVELAERMAGMQAGGGARPPGGIQGGARPTGQNGEQAGRGAMGSQRGGTIDDMLERFPNITANDITVGEVIAVSSTKTDIPTRVNAVKLLAGVEPFLRMAQAAAARGNGGGRGVSTGFTVPGLDDVGFQ